MLCQVTAGSAAGGAVTSEVDINDLLLACRNILTRGSTQEEVLTFLWILFLCGLLCLFFTKILRIDL